MNQDTPDFAKEKIPTGSGLERQESMVIDAIDEAPGGRSLGIGHRPVKGRDGKKEFTIC
ncbi:MAG: hypothetical protein HQL84_09995 [Magnetococcales bacterium]|nr:hypothetical protein [Magnetococcales bacterium]MBF0150362.1 hypothetical protein [Magnetococcales bacterium]